MKFLLVDETKKRKDKSRSKPSSRPKVCFGVGGRAKGVGALRFWEKG